MKKIFVIFLTLFLLIACAQSEAPIEEEQEEIKEEVLEPIEVTFNAVGDNLIHGAIYSGNMYVNNNYDYTPIYEHIKPVIQEVDISYLNQETILGGREIGLESYPVFNSPYEIGDAVVDAGFDWINHATNHSLDMGELGIQNALNYWDTKNDITVTGIARNQEEADQLKIIERNGLKFGLLSYTYGTNGIMVPEGKDYLVNYIDKEKIESDVNRLKSEVDSILISMHWGTEYSFLTDEVQEDLAQFIADLGVDVIVGSHPHVIQRMDKNGNDTLVIYSLGNFLSAQDVNYRMLGGMAHFTLQYNQNDKTKTIKNVKYTPIVNHFDANFTNFRIYQLKDYTPELSSSHGLSFEQEISYDYFKNLVDEVMGTKFEIDY